jgi:hypothetical protein
VNWLDVVIGWLCLGIGFAAGCWWRALHPPKDEQ